MKRLCMIALALSLVSLTSSQVFAQEGQSESGQTSSANTQKMKKKKNKKASSSGERISDAGNFGVGIAGGYGSTIGGTLKIYSGDTNAFQLEAGVPLGLRGTGVGGWSASLEYVTEYMITDNPSGNLFWGIGVGPGATNISFDTSIGGQSLSGSVTFIDIHLVGEIGYHFNNANIELLANYKPGFFVFPLPLPRLGTAGVSLRYFF